MPNGALNSRNTRRRAVTVAVVLVAEIEELANDLTEEIHIVLKNINVTTQLNGRKK